MTVTLAVDDKTLHVEEGASLLQACLSHDIFIPNLCFMEEMENPPASCRLCFVAIEGMDHPVTSCTVRVTEGMVVRTDTPEVRRLQRSGLRLLLSVHDVDCKRCQANKHCALQDTAKFLNMGLKPKGLEIELKDTEPDNSHPRLTYYPNRCVLCGKCIHLCRTANGQPLFAFSKRGFDTVIHFRSRKAVADLPCENCNGCAEVCPVGALIPKTSK